MGGRRTAKAVRTTDATLAAPRGTPPATPPPAGSAPGACVLGRYRLVRLLGHGGFATVWEATDVQLARQVAVKRIPRSALAAGARGDLVAERVTREARTVARLAHPAVVALFEASADEEAFYLVSELVVGPTLAELIAQGGLSDRDVMEIGQSLCRAVEHAHSRGIVHRDIKPANVIVPDARAAGGQCAKLTDFGVAHVLGEPALTRTGDVVGTLGYMAPEQAQAGAVGPPADIYALGVVLYEALGGRRPAPEPDPPRAARRAGPAASSLAGPRPDLPADLVGAIDDARAPDPRARARLPTLLRALARASRYADDEPRWAPPPRPWRPTLRHLGRRLAGGPSPPASLGIGARALGAVGTGALAALALAALGPASPLPPGVAGLAVAAVALALPRMAWAAAAVAVCAWLTLAQRPGLALFVALLALPNALLVRAPAGRPAPALAPVCGALGLAGAFPALAGQARRGATRVLLGALGAWWLCLAEVLLGRRMLLGPAAGTASRDAWQASLATTVSHALAPLAEGGVLALAAVWGLAALVLPWLVRGRAPVWDIAAAAAWAGGLALATHELARALGPALPGDPTRALVLGSLAAGAIAVGLSSARPARRDPAGERLGTWARRARTRPVAPVAPARGPALR